MTGAGDSLPAAGRRFIDEVAKAAFVAGVQFGGEPEEVAAFAGFTLSGFYQARARDAAFAAAWTAALEAAALRERGVAAEPAPPSSAAEACPGCGEPLMLVRSNNRRLLQKRRMRHLRFTAARKDAFLEQFAVGCDLDAAAAAVGIDRTTVHKHLRKDGEFAAAFQEALEHGYVVLEAEALQQRLAAQARMRRAIAEAPVPDAETQREFERVMSLLRRWDRKGERPGIRRDSVPRRTWTFDEAIRLLDKKLRAFGLRQGVIAPEDAGASATEAGDGGGGAGAE